MSDKNFRSPNFDFLGRHDELLVQQAALAERYVFTDANSSLIKLRQFAELLTKHAAAYLGLAVDPRESFFEVVNRLRSFRVTGPQVEQLIHGIRTAGNQAAHDHTGERREALHQLRMARKLAVWFHRTFGDRNFEAGPFVVPPDPTAAESDLLEELERLRKAEVEAQTQAQDLKATLETQIRLKAEAEQAAKTAFDDLEAAMQLAEESEQQRQADQEAYEKRLATLQAQSAAETPDKREAKIAEAQKQDAEVDLDEAATRHLIDAQLRESGWEVDSQTIRYSKGSRPAKGRNLAIAEWPTDKGPADYCLFVGLTLVAVVEAKRKRVDVAGAIEQAKRYSRGIKEGSEFQTAGPWGQYHAPFLFATNGRPFLRQLAEKSGIWFLDARRSVNHPRPLEAWYTPEGLSQLLAQSVEEAEKKLASETFDYLPLRDYQEAAIRSIETEVAAGKRDMLVAMATGTGKTMTCIGLIYRLIKSGRFRRILFMVDRSALGEQTADAFQNVRLENHQSFTDIYDIKQLGDIKPDTDTRLQIATVQGMVKRILYADDSTPPVPVDQYDCIVIDECHRGYNLDQEMTDSELEFRNEADYISKYRRVIDHFDAVRIGLTATPALHTTEIFGPPVYQYTYRQAVIDGWLVDHEPPFRIITQLSEDGIKWNRGDEMKLVDSKTSQLQLFNTPDEVAVEVEQFNRKVITENFNRTVCNSLAEHIDPSLPGKTLIFCVNDLHADMVVRLMKEAFEEHYGEVEDNAVVKITGKADKPLQLIRRFRNEQLPKVVVTVDLLTTGVDVPPITTLVFLRRVKSRILFEQMLGRATRLCEDLFGSGNDKDRFHIFDAVDLYSQLEEITDMRPVVTQVNISIEQLVQELTSTDDESFQQEVKDQLVAKLRRKKLSESQQEKLQTATGMNRKQLLDFIKTKPASVLADWFKQHDSTVSILSEVKESPTQYIISDHDDQLRRVERGYGDAKKPEDYLDAFRQYVTQHLNDLPALVVVTQRPRDLTRKQLRELRLAMDEAGFSEANLRSAWRETTNQEVAASIIGYIRHVALDQPLIAHADRVKQAMKKIMSSRSWTGPQRKWLERIGK